MTCDYVKVYRVTALPPLADQELNAWYLVSGSTGIMEIYVKGNDPLADPRTLDAIASAVGANTQVQFNNNGLFGASADFTFDDAANRLFVNGNFRLSVTSGSSAGVIEVGTARFLHSYGVDNVFLGGNAGNFAMTGGSNVGIGSFAGFSLTSGSRNMLFGYAAGDAITTGASNLGIGAFALSAVTSGGGNVGLGDSAGIKITTGGANVGIGSGAIGNLLTGSYNVAIGQSTGADLDNGLFNVIIGSFSGSGLVSGSYNVFIGRISNVAAGLSHTIILADGEGNERLRMDANRADFKVPVKCSSYTVLTTPSASTAGAGSMIYVTNETGGAVPAFSDGTSWRRVTDRAIIS